MPFEVESNGHSFAIPKHKIILEAAIDSLPLGATQAQIDGRIVQTIVGELRGPKRLETVRRRFLQLWPLIAPLAEREPEQFDAILLEFAELTTSLG